MTIQTLESITVLFAIAANHRENTDTNDCLKAYANFLNDKVDEAYHHNFLEKFPTYLNDYSSTKSGKRLSLNSVRIIRLCTSMKKNLPRNERFKIIFYISVLVRQTGQNNTSQQFIELVASLFDLDDEVTKIVVNDPLLEQHNNHFKTLTLNNTDIARVLNTGYNSLIIKGLDPDTKVNDKPLPVLAVQLCEAGHVVRHGTKRYFYNELCELSATNDANATENFTIEIEDLEYRVRQKTILHTLNASFDNGSMIGVLGNSGSGKTTFLRCLAHALPYSGNIELVSNGYGRRDYDYGYVAQEVGFADKLSINELMHRRANVLQLPKADVEAKIDEVLMAVQLYEHRNKVFGVPGSRHNELSGGQIKRLSIATELLSSPNVVLVDEPTSGLSSQDAMTIMSLLKNIANKNKIVVATIHQPDFDLFMMFDKILIIDDSGYPIYFDTPAKAADYFRRHTQRVDKCSLLETSFNPAILFDLINERKCDAQGNLTNERKITPTEWYTHYVPSRTSTSTQRTSLEPRPAKRFNKWRHFVDDLRFELKVEMKQKLRLLLIFAIPAAAGVLFSLLTRFAPTDTYHFYHNPNIAVWLLILLMTAVFIGLVSSGHEFIRLRNFYKNENRICDKRGVLLWAKVCKYAVVAILQALCMVLPACALVGAWFFAVKLTIVVAILTFWGCLLGLWLSLLLPTTDLVYLIIPLIIIPQMIFSGALLRFDELNKHINAGHKVPLIANIIPMRWATEAAITEMSANNPYEQHFINIDRMLANASYTTDFFLPFVSTLTAENAHKILTDFCKKNNFSCDKNLPNDTIINRLRNYFTTEKMFVLNLKDSIYASDNQLSINKLTCVNKQIERIVSGYYRNGLIVDNGTPIRLYKPVLITPETWHTNRLFLCGIKNIGNNTFIRSFTYNNVVLLLYCVILCLICRCSMKTLKN